MIAKFLDIIMKTNVFRIVILVLLIFVYFNLNGKIQSNKELAESKFTNISADIVKLQEVDKEQNALRLQLDTNLSSLQAGLVEAKKTDDKIFKSLKSVNKKINNLQKEFNAA